MTEDSNSELRALLAGFSVPEPSPDFVEDTLLAIEVGRHPDYVPTPGFVDRVSAAIAEDRDGREAAATVVPLRRFPWPRVAAAALTAAAVLVAVWPSADRMALSPRLIDLVEVSYEPMDPNLGSSYARVRPAFANGFVLPPPPPAAVDTGLFDGRDPWDDEQWSTER